MTTVELTDDLVAAITAAHPGLTLEQALASVVGTGLKVLEDIRQGEIVLVFKRDRDGRVVRLVPR